MNQRWWPLIGAALFGVLGIQAAHAQIPERWFPLALGNAWHYDVPYTWHGFNAKWVDKVVADTVVGGQRWAHVKTVWWGGFDPEWTSTDRWYGFSPDHFLLVSSRPVPPAEADTLHKTTLLSVFIAQPNERDGFPAARGRYACEDSPYVTVQTDADPRGRTADSTNLVLSFNKRGCYGSYRYNVGGPHSHYYYAHNLLGAMIDGKPWGNTAHLERVLTSIEESVSATTTFRVGPNPTRGQIMLVVPEGLTGLVMITVADVAGRHVATVYQGDLAGSTRYMYDGSGLAPGAYFVQIRLQDRVSTLPFVVVP